MNEVCCGRGRNNSAYFYRHLCFPLSEIQSKFRGHPLAPSKDFLSLLMSQRNVCSQSKLEQQTRFFNDAVQAAQTSPLHPYRLPLNISQHIICEERCFLILSQGQTPIRLPPTRQGGWAMLAHPLVAKKGSGGLLQITSKSLLQSSEARQCVLITTKKIVRPSGVGC